MTRNDENAFIKAWSSQSISFVSPWLRKGNKIQALAKAPPALSPGKDMGPSRPGSLYMIDWSGSPKLTFELGVKNYAYLSDMSSDVIALGRTDFEEKEMSCGCFSMDFRFGPVPEYLDELWKEIKKWLRRNYFALPKSGGFVGPDAMKLALKRIRLVGFKHTYKIALDKRGKYKVSFRL